ncbi:MAG: B-box zinc finger protein [Anaerolineae bacterium]
MNTDTAMYCRHHRRRETGLTCRKCGKPICPECARSRPRIYIGYWCKDCDARLPGIPKLPRGRSQQTVTWKFDVVGSLIGTVLLTAGAAVGGPIGVVIGIGLWWFIMSLRR